MLDQLYYFSEVYRNRSISRAADFLHISRQALSHSVKGLEQELGVELFVREKDGVVPTKAADSLYESAQVILREEAQIRENMLSFTHKSADIRQYTIAAPMFYVNSYGETLSPSWRSVFQRICSSSRRSKTATTASPVRQTSTSSSS